ncbi:hypothetical protein B0T10DRAFT_602695 [Thelonectria olida]|uniref:Uncharacterized protein n=1 Tax=Thelonectria olida TaxID=1576542 RepID=A0A9P9AS25_9HYPO|nr:hypothetical protein B0T10DRAFT_602695 [Thelonectria olida]
MSFHFVNNAAADTPGARRAIRRHVMKGKNLGRKIEGRGRKHAPRRNETHGVAKPLLDKTKSVEDVEDVVEYPENGHLLFPEITEDPLQSNVFNGHEFEYFSFPVQFNPKMRYLVYQYHTAIFEALYPYPFCRPSTGASPPWLEYMVNDQAFLHALLGMASTYHYLFNKPGSETIEARQHFSQAFRLVHSDLSKPSIPADSTLAVIITLAIHGGLMRDTHQSRVHLEGIEGTLALRPGGLSSLRETNPYLLHKICRADIEHALQVGQPTRFGLLSVVKNNLLGKSTQHLPHPLNQMSMPLRAITTEIMAFCKQPSLSGLAYQDLITWMWQRLVDFAPLRSQRPQNPLDDVWHLSVLAFLATVTFATDFLRAARTTLVSEMLRDRVRKDPLSALGRDYLPLRFWIAFISGVLLQDAETCLASQLKVLAREMGIFSWEDAKSTLETFPWVEIVHEKPGKKLWESQLLPADMF